MIKIGGKFPESATPLDALEHAREYVFLSSMLGPHNNRPGYIIEKLSKDPDFARIISELTSEMTQNERPFWKR